MRPARRLSVVRPSSSSTTPRFFMRSSQVVDALVGEDDTESEDRLEHRDEAREERDEEEQDCPRRQGIEAGEMPETEGEDDCDDAERQPLQSASGADVAEPRLVFGHGGRATCAHA